MLKTEDLLAASPRPIFDVFSYHFYGAVSKRCASMMGPGFGTTPDAALTGEWLSRTELVRAFYAGLRDRFAPGAPMWLTETAEAACGGNPWAKTFLDSFRYLDQLGRLARQGVQVVMHNTLAASEYALIDQATLTPRPNYWAALLWRRLMGSTVLDAGPSNPGVHLYAHCMAGRPGGVTLLAINTNQTACGVPRSAHPGGTLHAVGARRWTKSTFSSTAATCCSAPGIVCRHSSRIASRPAASSLRRPASRSWPPPALGTRVADSESWRTSHHETLDCALPLAVPGVRRVRRGANAGAACRSPPSRPAG